MKRTKNKFNILALDPSMRGFGWSVLSGMDILDSGCIKTEPEHKKLRIRKGDDDVRRLNEVCVKLESVCKAYNITFIVSELPHGSQSASAAAMLGMTKGIVQGLSVFLDIPIEWYSEQDAKKNALGKNSAAKREMIDRMSEIYDPEWTGKKYIDEAVADSLAIHYVASKTSATLKLVL